MRSSCCPLGWMSTMEWCGPSLASPRAVLRNTGAAADRVAVGAWVHSCTPGEGENHLSCSSVGSVDVKVLYVLVGAEGTRCWCGG
jgi:hypothetical protein